MTCSDVFVMSSDHRRPTCKPRPCKSANSKNGGNDKKPHFEEWDEYFLTIALAVSLKSKDPKCQVGAVIVSGDQIISTGFNGLARGVLDDETILNDGRPDGEKLKLICHAEANAVFNAARVGVPVNGSTIYVTKFPCLSCCNAIVQAGIKRICTHDDKYWDDDPLDGLTTTTADGLSDKEHQGKRKILQQARIVVTAPFHPHYPPHYGHPVRRRAKIESKSVSQRIASVTITFEPVIASSEGNNNGHNGH